MALVPPGAVGLKFWPSVAQPFDPRTANTWNVWDKSANITLSDSNKTATANSATSAGVRSTTTHLNETAGKFYAEFLLSNIPLYAGLLNSTRSITLFSSGLVIHCPTGNLFITSTGSAGLNSAFANGDILCLAWDSGTQRIWFRKNNNLWNNDAAADPATGANGYDASTAPADSFALWINTTASGDSVTLRTELADLTYIVPSGFTSWMGETLSVPEITGVGDLAADVAAISGTGDVGSAEAIGDGALAADAAALSGTGSVSAAEATGTGALAAQNATTSGAGAVASVGSGALVAQVAAVAGSGLSASAGTGVLQATAAAVVGAGALASTGTGSLVAGPAEVAGTGTAAAANSGVLVAQAATVAGLGVSASTGSGALQAGAAIVAGQGLVASVGNGDLVAGSATVAGTGDVIAAGAAVGTGALVAGAATVSGEGEVTGEVAPPVSVGGGYWRWPQRRPVAVEGIGYAILPQLEGEAHGLVGTDADGVATLSGVVGAAVATVGVDGRSVARLAIRAAVIGDCGSAGFGSGDVTLKGAAVGRHDDDEAAMIALLLAA